MSASHTFSISSATFRYLRRDWHLSTELLQFKSRALYFVVGSNMSGKSTLLSTLAGLSDATFTGEVAYGSTAVSLNQLQSKILLLSANDPLFPELSVWDNVRIVLPPESRADEQKKYEACRAYLMEAGIFSGTALDEPLGQLSTGGRAHVKLCRARISSFPIVLIDELTSFLDNRQFGLALNQVIAIIERQMTVIFVSHNDRDHRMLDARCAAQKIPTYLVRIERESIARSWINGAEPAFDEARP